MLSWWDLIGNFCSVVLTFDLIDCQVIKKKKKIGCGVAIQNFIDENRFKTISSFFERFPI